MEVKSPVPSATSLRPLGHVEKYSTIRSHLGIYLNVGLTARYRRPSGGTVKPRLFGALSILISKHPDTVSYPCWGRYTKSLFCSTSQNLSEVVECIDENTQPRSSDWREELDNVLEDQHNRPFETLPNQTLPFWRICVLEEHSTPTHFTLIFIFHHSLMDTQSALSFHEELERYMAQDTGAEVPDMISTPSTPLPPPLEDLHTLPISQDYLRSQEKQHFPPPDSWTGAPQSLPVKTRFSSLWLSPAETHNLVNMSKNEQTSVTGALQTLITTSVFTVLPSTYRTLQVDCAVSLRRFLLENITATPLGCYVGSFSMEYRRMTSFSWSEARRTKAIIEQIIEKKGGDMSVGYLRFIPDLHLWMRQKLGRKRMSAFELSNVGRIPASRGRLQYEIASMLFSQGASACSAAIKVSAVTGRDGRLVLGFTWQEGVVEGDMVEQIIRVLKGEVEGLVVQS
ncbi:alcohol acetyltransferase [Aspergillus alliaceus]|uniref:Alcohol acetyltransferase n=1 Tax=Petromyces alliaceus TaxID=209559 RepID=A0A5N7CQQ4_PETAA|nr:alcohol acetyltransferase [Aspergillus alliaceus]